MGDERGIRRADLEKQEPKPRGIIRTLLLGFLGIVVGALISPIGDPVRPLFAPATEWVERTYQQWRDPIPPVQNRREFIVLIADFEGDDAARTQSRRIAEGIAAQFPNAGGRAPIRVLRYPRTLSLSASGDMTSSREQADRLGRGWMLRINGDLLVWGVVRPANEEIEVRFIGPRIAEMQFELRDQSIRGELVERIAPIVALTFTMDALSDAVHADNVGDPNQNDVPRLTDQQQLLERILQQTPPGFAPIYVAQLHHAHGLVLYQLALRNRQREMMEAAVRSYDRALGVGGDADLSRLQGMMHTNRGNALIWLGRTQRDEAVLRRGLDDQRVAITMAQDQPLLFGNAQNNLGSGLLELARMRGGDAALFEQSISAYRAALTVYNTETTTRSRIRTLWNLSDTLTAASRGGTRPGYLETSTDVLQEAVAVARAAGDERAAASILGNAGANYMMLAFREENRDFARRAADMLGGAVTESQRLGMRDAWANAQNNLGLSHMVLARTAPTRAEALAEYARAFAAFDAAETVWSPSHPRRAQLDSNRTTARTNFEQLQRGAPR